MRKAPASLAYSPHKDGWLALARADADVYIGRGPSLNDAIGKLRQSLATATPEVRQFLFDLTDSTLDPDGCRFE